MIHAWFYSDEAPVWCEKINVQTNTTYDPMHDFIVILMVNLHHIIDTYAGALYFVKRLPTICKYYL